MEYVQIQKHWRKLRHVYADPGIRDLWYPDMELHRLVRCEELGITYTPLKVWDKETFGPHHFDSTDWRFTRQKPGPMPHYWRWVCHSACHYLTRLSMHVATTVWPKKPWRIVTSQLHSTLWDGDQNLYDPNFLALQVPADEAWELATNQPDSIELEPGETFDYDYTGIQLAWDKQ